MTNNVGVLFDNNLILGYESVFFETSFSLVYLHLNFRVET